MTKSINAESPEDQPHTVDMHVGARIRLRRKELGISQGDLAESLGLTFQQVQKYERGANRVSASKLYDTAKALNTPVAWFFDDLPEITPGGEGYSTTKSLNELLSSEAGLELIHAAARLSRPRRTLVAKLMTELLGEGDDEQEIAA